MKLTLYYAPGACSLASHIALEESGLAYEAFRINTAAGEQRSPEYLKVNSRGRVPTLVIDGRTLTENVAIMTFIAGGHPKSGLWPTNTLDQAEALSVMSWLANTVHPAFAHIFRTERYSDDANTYEAIKNKGRETFWNCLKEIDAMVAGRRWYFGNRFTVVDGYLLVFYRWGLRIHLDMKSLPHYTALVERVASRPAVKRVMAEEGIALQP